MNKSSASNERRVVITGLGIYSAIGQDVESFWDGCLTGTSKIEEIPKHWKKYEQPHSKFWSPLPEIDYKSHGYKKYDLLQMDPASLNALIATEQAVQNAELDIAVNPENASRKTICNTSAGRIGVFMGTGTAGVSTLIDGISNQSIALPLQAIKSLIDSLEDAGSEQKKWLTEQLNEKFVFSKKFSPFVVPRFMSNAIAANIGIRYSINGPVRNSATACAAGTIAIGQAFHAIQSGEVDIAITGGSEYLDDPYGGLFKGFDVARTLTTGEDPETCNRPFDKTRAGFLFSQGASCSLILENYDDAVARNAPIIAEVAAYAESFDAYDLLSVNPSGEQAISMLNRLLDAAGLAANDIDYINSHGTGTHVNDEAESNVLLKLFGNKPLINSTKSILGHTIGASGAIEAAVAALSIRDQKVHISKNLIQPINELNYAFSSCDAKVDHVISESFAFGGHNAALLLKRIT